MKKHGLGLILALSLLAVTGSVYSVWTYHTGKVQAFANDTSKTNMAAKVDEGTVKGSFSLGSNDVVISFDVTSNDDYTPKVTATGNLVFNYTETSAEGSAAVGAIEASITLSEGAVFTLKDAGKISCTLSGTTVTIPAATILSHLSFDTKKLSTPELYDAFKGKVDATTITVSIAEK